MPTSIPSAFEFVTDSTPVPAPVPLMRKAAIWRVSLRIDGYEGLHHYEVMGASSTDATAAACALLHELLECYREETRQEFIVRAHSVMQVGV